MIRPYREVLSLPGALAFCCAAGLTGLLLARLRGTEPPVAPDAAVHGRGTIAWAGLGALALTLSWAGGVLGSVEVVTVAATAARGQSVAATLAAGAVAVATAPSGARTVTARPTPGAPVPDTRGRVAVDSDGGPGRVGTDLQHLAAPRST